MRLLLFVSLLCPWFAVAQERSPAVVKGLAESRRLEEAQLRIDIRSSSPASARVAANKRLAEARKDAKRIPVINRYWVKPGVAGRLPGEYQVKNITDGDLHVLEHYERVRSPAVSVLPGSNPPTVSRTTGGGPRTPSLEALVLVVDADDYEVGDILRLDLILITKKRPAIMNKQTAYLDAFEAEAVEIAKVKH